MNSLPFFRLSRSIVLEQYKKTAEISDSVSYSYKTNKDVGSILRDNTCCSFSVHELASIDQLGCPERVWFFAQAWNSEEVGMLFEKGVRRFVVDNVNDLDILLRNAKDSFDLLLRMRLKENTIHTGKHFVYGMFSDEIKSLLQKLKENKTIGKLGIHFHRKTQNISEWSLKMELENIFDEEYLKNIDIVNIGGGIPSVYKNFRARVLDGIFEKIRELRLWLNQKGISMIIEPGRFIAAPSVEFITHIANIYNGNIVVDASLYNGAMDTFVSNVRLKIAGEIEQGGAEEAFTIKGKTPDSIDIFRYRAFLKDPKIGDEIIFQNAGAYTYSTDFCGLKKPETIIVD